MNIILKKSKNNFSYIKYFLFTYLKKYSVYEKYIDENVFFIPYKKTLKKRYFKALCEFLKRKNTDKILVVEEDIKKEFKKYFSVINGKNIYNTIFCDILNFMSKNRLFEYEIIFVSDNIKEIKNMIEKCIKKVKGVGILTKKPELYESMKEFTLSKYGVVLNIKKNNEKLKKHNKIYVNCGNIKVFDESFFKNVTMLDFYNVYEGAQNKIILEQNQKEKELTKKLNVPYTIDIAEFLYEKINEKEYKIVNIKK